MRNHNEKLRDIGRSVLPARGRKGWRAGKRAIHHRNRQQTRAALQDWADAIDPYDCEALTYDYSHEINSLVRERRLSDNLTVIMRWAEATIRQHPEITEDYETCYHYFKRILPDNLAGRHALSHLKDCEGFPEDPAWPLRYQYRRSNEDWAERQQRERDRLVAKCYDILVSPRAHRRFNRALKQRTVRQHYRSGWNWKLGKYVIKGEPYTCDYCDESARTLDGAHDIEAFVDYAYAASLHHTKEVLEGFKI